MTCSYVVLSPWLRAYLYQCSTSLFFIASKLLTPREQQKLILTPFKLENILSSLALESGTVNNNLIINSTSLQHSLLGAVKILHHVTKYGTPEIERVFFAYSTNSYHYSKSLGIDAFIPASFNVTRNCSHMEKIKLFYFQCFFLLAGDDVKTNDLELYSCRVFRCKCFCKKLYFGYCNLFMRKDILERYL